MDFHCLLKVKKDFFYAELQGLQSWRQPPHTQSPSFRAEAWGILPSCKTFLPEAFLNCSTKRNVQNEAFQGRRKLEKGGETWNPAGKDFSLSSDTS